MGLFGNWACNFKMLVSNRAKTRFLVDSSNTWGHYDDESIIAKKNLNGPLFGFVGLHTSAFICSRNLGIKCIALCKAG
jgi:hypothetical protein